MGRKYAKRKKKSSENIWFQRVERIREGTDNYISTFKIIGSEPPLKVLKDMERNANLTNKI